MNKKVTPFETFAASLGSISDNYSSLLVALLATNIFSVTLGVDPFYVGIGLMIPRFWDAIIDPIIGHWTDNCRSRFGRRKPFMAFGSISMGLLFMGLWFVPESFTEFQKVTWFVVFSLLYYTCHSIFSIPFWALMYGISNDSNERVRVYKYISVCRNLINLSGNWFFPLVTSAVFASTMQGMRTVGIVMGLVMIVCGLIPVLFVKENGYTAEKEDFHFKALFKEIIELLKVRPFILAIGVEVTLIFVGIIVSGLGNFITIYHVAEGDVQAGATIGGWIGSGFGLMGIISIPIIGWVSERVGKIKAFQYTVLVCAFGGILKYFVYRPDIPYIYMLDPLICGSIWGAMILLVPAMIADVCDFDEYHTGKRREAMFGSLRTWVIQLGISLSMFCSNTIISFSGFETGKNAQAVEAIELWKIIFSALTVVSCLIAWLILKVYPLNEQFMQNLQIKLEERKTQS